MADFFLKENNFSSTFAIDIISLFIVLASFIPLVDIKQLKHCPMCKYLLIENIENSCELASEEVGNGKSFHKFLNVVKSNYILHRV